MKKFWVLLLLIALTCVFSEPSFAKVPDKDIIILYTNDVHCGVDENIGYAGFAFCAEEARKQTPYVTLVDAGDWAQGGTIGAISQGRYIVEIMNAVGYDVAVPGNHDFDYAFAQFENYAHNLKCGFICCNLRDLRTGQLVLKPYKILTYGDVKVAYVGVTTPETIIKTTPYYFEDENGNFIYDFDGDTTGQKLIASIQKAVDAARAEGADYVILVGHLGENKEDVTEVWSTPFIAPRTHGIDVMIDGHTHEVTPAMHVKNSEGKDVIITQTGTKLHNVGKLTISKEGKITTEMISKVDGRDEKVKTLINEKKAIMAKAFDAHITYSSFDLPAMDAKGDWLVRAGETNLCNLVTDSFLDSAKKTKTGKADIAVINAGALRKNINAGGIKYIDVLNVLPFNNTVCICEVPGQSLLDELEVGARMLPGNFGGFLHVSGMTYTVDSTIPSPVIVDDKGMFVKVLGDRRVRDVKVNGEPIDPAKMYKVVSISYVLYQRGDGHIFNGSKVIEPDYIAYDVAAANYMKQFETLPERYRNAEGRIKFVK